MSSATLDPSLCSNPVHSTASRRWLVNPWFDVLLVANVAWPLLVVLQWSDGFEGRAGLKFWQVYFVTTPHRWITLAIVFLDRERFEQNRMVFLGWLGVIVTACLADRLTTGRLACLLAIDYVWNAWHFASQHQGIYRIYGLLTDSSRSWSVLVERWSLRLFLLYVTLRVAVATWSDADWQPIFEAADWLAPAIPITLLIRDCAMFHRVATGRIVYLLSVSILYLSLLWAVHAHRPGYVLSLTTASALFHALEYLSIVSWTVRKREASHHQNMGWLGVVASRWLLALCGFLVLLGAGAWMIDQQWGKEWLFVNIIAGFLHYAYDGLIWHHRPSPVRARVAVGSARA